MDASRRMTVLRLVVATLDTTSQSRAGFSLRQRRRESDEQDGNTDSLDVRDLSLKIAGQRYHRPGCFQMRRGHQIL
jgi:hypothetical protein